MLLDQEERIIFANAPARAIFGFQVTDRLGAAVLRHPGFLDALGRVLRLDEPAETRAMLAEAGQEVVLNIHLRPVRISRERGVLAILEDLSAFEKAAAIRRDFVANVSHELRTPLTAFVGFIETLKGPARRDAAARDRFLSVMETEATRMIRLVNDLLSLSRVEAEERRRPADRVDLPSVLNKAILAQTAQASAAGVEITLAGADAPATVQGDADQLMQVFLNLIENAIKYGAPGKQVTLRLTKVGREPVLKGPAVQVEVADQGEGIDPIHLPRLTERFYRVDSHRSRAQGGTGLGLAIVKHIVNRHRGRLKIESTPKKGSSFIVILPEA
jgi:two-component system phosphate regulon sensor histidine kinase PhoR